MTPGYKLNWNGRVKKNIEELNIKHLKNVLLTG